MVNLSLGLSLRAISWELLPGGPSSMQYDVYSSGSGDNPVVCVHGMGGSHSDCELLRYAGYPGRVIAVDFNNEGSLWSVSLIEAHSKFLLEVLEDHCTSGCHILAYSAGSPISVEALRLNAAKKYKKPKILSLNMISPPLLNHPAPIDLAFEAFYGRLRAFLPSLNTFPVYVRHSGWRDFTVPFELSDYSLQGFSTESLPGLYSSLDHINGAFNLRTTEEIIKSIQRPSELYGQTRRVSLAASSQSDGMRSQPLLNISKGCYGVGPITLDIRDCTHPRFLIQLIGASEIGDLEKAKFDVKVLKSFGSDLYDESSLMDGFKGWDFDQGPFSNEQTKFRSIWIAEHYSGAVDYIVVPAGVRVAVRNLDDNHKPIDPIITSFSLKNRHIFSSVVVVHAPGFRLVNDVGSLGSDSLACGPNVETVWALSLNDTLEKPVFTIEPQTSLSYEYLLSRIYHAVIAVLVSLTLLGSQLVIGDRFKHAVVIVILVSVGMLIASFKGGCQKFVLTVLIGIAASIFGTITFYMNTFILKQIPCDFRLPVRSERRVSLTTVVLIAAVSFIGTMYPGISLFICHIAFIFRRGDPDRVSWILMLVSTVLNIMPLIGLLAGIRQLALPFGASGIWWGIVTAYMPTLYTGMVLFVFGDRMTALYKHRMRLASIGLGAVSLMMVAAGIVAAYQIWVVNVWLLFATILRVLSKDDDLLMTD